MINQQIQTLNTQITILTEQVEVLKREFTRATDAMARTVQSHMDIIETIQSNKQ